MASPSQNPGSQDGADLPDRSHFNNEVEVLGRLPYTPERQSRHPYG